MLVRSTISCYNVFASSPPECASGKFGLDEEDEEVLSEFNTEVLGAPNNSESIYPVPSTGVEQINGGTTCMTACVFARSEKDKPLATGCSKGGYLVYNKPVNSTCITLAQVFANARLLEQAKATWFVELNANTLLQCQH